MRPYNTTHKQITKNNHKQKNCLTKSNLQKNKMLASTIQFSHNTHTPQKQTTKQQPARSTQQPVNRNNNKCVIPDTQQRTNNQPTQKESTNA